MSNSVKCVKCGAGSSYWYRGKCMSCMPAYPVAADLFQNGSGGMTLRDRFAEAAMAAMISAVGGSLADDEMKATICQESYIYADAMLKERVK